MAAMSRSLLHILLYLDSFYCFYFYIVFICKLIVYLDFVCNLIS